MGASRFRAGDRVRLRAEPTAVGRIDGDALPYSGGWTYPVFFGGTDVRNVAETGLELAPEKAAVAVLTREVSAQPARGKAHQPAKQLPLRVQGLANGLPALSIQTGLQVRNDK